MDPMNEEVGEERSRDALTYLVVSKQVAVRCLGRNCWQQVFWAISSKGRYENEGCCRHELPQTEFLSMT